MYPAAILAQHGVVLDVLRPGPSRLPGDPTAVRPSCSAAEAQGKKLHFEAVGVIGANEVFGDKETGSHWQQPTLTAISGPLRGERLDLYPFLLTSWGEWRPMHPNTLMLKPTPGYAERIPKENRLISGGV